MKADNGSNHPYWPGFESYYSTFEQECPEDERRVLQVLSLPDLPLPTGTLERILTRLQWENSDGVPLSAHYKRLLPHWRRKWEEQEWITDDGQRLRCSRFLVDMLSRQLVSEGTIAEVADAVNQVINSGYWASGVDPEIRPLRLAFYQNDFTYLQRWLGLDQDNLWQGEIPPEKEEVITNFCYFPLQRQWLQQLPDWLLYHALVGPIRTDLLEVEGTALLWDFWAGQVEPNSSDHPSLRIMAATFRFYRGEHEQMQQLLDGTDVPDGRKLSGWSALSQGNIETALPLLEPYSSSTQSIQNGPGPLFLQMLHLHEGSFDALKQVSALADRFESELDDAGYSVMDRPFGPAVLIMREVARLLMGVVELKECTLLQRERIHSVWDQLIHVIARYWVGEPITDTQLEVLQGDARRAVDAGIGLYHQQYEILLQQMENTRQGIEDNQQTGWASLIRPKQKWEMVLDAISGMAQQHSTDQQDDEPIQRLAWRIEKQQYSLPLLHPREQRLGKSGRWSKGRAISLKKLYETRDQYTFLTDQDQRICNTISERSTYSSSSYQRKLVYELNRPRAIWELIGHPAVELENSEGVTADVVRQDPALEVVELEAGESLRIQLVPFPIQQPNGNFEEIGCHWEGGRRLVVSRFESPHLRVAQILGSNGVTIPMAARERLLDSITSIAPLLTVHSTIGGGSADVKQLTGESTPHLHLLPEAGGIRFSFWVAPMGPDGPRFYPGNGGTVVFGEINGEKLQAHRDLQQEQQRALQIIGGIEEVVPELFFEITQEHLLDERLIEDPELSLELLFHLRSLDDDEVVLEWPQGSKIPRISEVGLGQMRVGVQQSREWFALNGELEINQGQVIALKELWAMVEHSNGRFLKLEDGEILALSRELQRRLEVLHSYGAEEGKIHPSALSAVDEALEGMDFHVDQNWEERRNQIEEANYLSITLPTTLEADLRDYQLQGYQWMIRLAHWGAGACLADDMGLGKTLQALTTVLSRAADGPTLVLAPTSVCMNWIEEANRFTPTLNPILFGDLNGAERNRQIDQIASFDLLVCSYGLMQREAKQLQSVEWQTVVIDEAQAIKNAATKRSQAVMELKGAFKLITTGTPIENHLGELWNLFRFINPGLLGSLERFNERFARPIEVDGDDHARQRLKNLISPFILRRLKRDVLSELPPRTEITLHVEMHEEEAVFMEALRQRSIERINALQQGKAGSPQHLQVLAEITRLRQACCHPKLVDPETAIGSAKHRVFTEVVQELLDNGHRALVFSQFVTHLDLIRNILDQQGVRYQYLDGSTPASKRKQIVDAFQSGEGELFLISLKAGGAGLNLTAADYVIHMDPWWNPAVEDQASDRAHRMGQTRPVTIYRLVLKGTIEERIVDLHQHKRDLADQLLEGSDRTGKLSVDEMISLIQDGAE